MPIAILISCYFFRCYVARTPEISAFGGMQLKIEMNPKERDLDYLFKQSLGYVILWKPKMGPHQESST
jgi:hypothetical protein